MNLNAQPLTQQISTSEAALTLLEPRLQQQHSTCVLDDQSSSIVPPSSLSSIPVGNRSNLNRTIDPPSLSITPHHQPILQIESSTASTSLSQATNNNNNVVCKLKNKNRTPKYRATKRPHSERKFQCEYCESRFFTQKDVKRHMVVHTRAKNFACPYCEQRFGRRDHLVRHAKKSHDQDTRSSKRKLRKSANESADNNGSTSTGIVTTKKGRGRSKKSISNLMAEHQMTNNQLQVTTTRTASTTSLISLTSLTTTNTPIYHINRDHSNFLTTSISSPSASTSTGPYGSYGPLSFTTAGLTSNQSARDLVFQATSQTTAASKLNNDNANSCFTSPYGTGLQAQQRNQYTTSTTNVNNANRHFVLPNNHQLASNQYSTAYSSANSIYNTIYHHQQHHHTNDFAITALSSGVMVASPPSILSCYQPVNVSTTNSITNSGIEIHNRPDTNYNTDLSQNYNVHIHNNNQHVSQHKSSNNATYTGRQHQQTNNPNMPIEMEQYGSLMITSNLLHQQPPPQTSQSTSINLVVADGDTTNSTVAATAIFISPLTNSSNSAHQQQQNQSAQSIVNEGHQRQSTTNIHTQSTEQQHQHYNPSF